MFTYLIKKILNKSAETIISTSAIIIALASICISIWESSIMREHYHLSVRPRLDYTFTVSENNAGFLIRNKGLGPAIIKTRDYYIDGKILDETKNHFSILIKEALNINTPTTFNSINKGKTIQAGEEINLFSLNFQNNELYYEIDLN